MPATQPSIASYFSTPLRLEIGYAERLVADIPEQSFAHMPHPTMNHPAFCLGHLSLYPNRALGLIGRSDLIVEKPGYDALFKAGVECIEQDGRYPSKDEITAYFFERHRALADALDETDEEVFQRENPTEGRFREMLPTVGAAVGFLTGGHLMVHLGQISGWRRAMGMASAM